MARPTDYKREFCERVVELGKAGASRVEIAYELDVVMATIQNWEAAHPEFLAAMTRSREASQVWWERKGRDNLQSAVFQASMWSRSMAARFPADWREKTDNTTTLNAGEGLAELLVKAGSMNVFPKADNEPDA